ncbi:peptidoglycan-associated lipoprotein Pal [Candidatus Enterovibrio altilux]|uniref:Peptidoglycan-associated lipoprotein n=1 Tax=Candidatus Enterovibrio altilux TaxID=1927128 RepID=A0A291BBQ3_9GAMM|nr:peptidoglycan-associated lipoprotein Pal [Candidatus Enterovibrio luxaltus]ATF10426.1 18K peptidoglycan-associated outer membrane lipoprotein [Candidatus Enterovibrio luxaltus]
MKLNKVLKNLAVTLPMFTIVACSSIDSLIDSSGSQPINDAKTTVITPVIDDGHSSLMEHELHNNKLRQSQTVYFNYNDYSVSLTFEDMLNAHAAFLRTNNSINVIVEGHADERGTPEYNIVLGERRANAVAKYLQTLGVPASQIVIVSYGEEKPLMLGQGEDVYAKNRRAVLVY